MYAKDLQELRLDERDTSSYTFVALAVGFWALRQHNFRDTIEALILEGGETGPNAALAGALLGCKLGLGAIPEEWMQQLRKRDWLEDKINK